MNKEFGLVSENNGSTVVAQYEGLKRKDTSYQSEAQLEQEFIDTLKDEGYEYLIFNSEEELVNNLRHKIEELNHYTFDDDEWNNFLSDKIVSVYLAKHKRTLLKSAAEDNLSNPLAKNKRDNLKLIENLQEQEKKDATRNVVIMRIPNIYDE